MTPDANNTRDDSLMLLPASQTITESLTGLALSTSRELEQVWDKIGLSPEERADQLTDLLSTFRKACDEKVASEHEVAENYKQMIVDYKNEIRTTCAALKIPADDDLLKEDSSQSLQDEVYVLELALEDLRNLADTSRKELLQFRDRLMEHHEALGISLDKEWKDVESDLTVPRVEAFEDRVKEVEAIVATRTSAVVQLVRDSQELIRALKVDEHENLMDHKIMRSLVEAEDGRMHLVSLSETDDCTGISAGTLQVLTDRMSELHGEKRRRKAKLAEMGNTIGELWEKLHVPKEEQNDFAKSIDGLGLDTLEKGEKEIVRLLALKEAMMGRLIVDARKQIKALWDETNATEEQMAVFQGMSVQDESLLNDELLSQHEEHIIILEKKLEQMQPILDVIEKREAVIVERMQYEEFLKDPTRLQQRGAALTQQLMKEEKMSRRIKKDLPKYTDHLSKKLKEWAQTQDESFLYKGDDYLTKMGEQQEEWQLYKDEQAQMKRQKKQEERTSYATKSSGGFQRKNAGSILSHSSAPLQDKTNKGHDVEKDGKARPLSRFRAFSKSRNNVGSTDTGRTKSRPRAESRVRGKSKDPSRPKSRPRAVSKVRSQSKDPSRPKSRLRAVSKIRSKSKEPSSQGNASRGRGFFNSRGRAQPIGHQ
jgi:protein regulator of cytokinesis 1